MIKLSNNEIDNTCKAIVDVISKEYPYYEQHIKLMYLYGCRIGEVFDYRILFDAESGKVNIDAQKNNNMRILPMVNKDVPKLIEILNLTQDNDYLNKRNLQRIIDKANPYRALYCGNKRIGAHLFRHNWIKQQFADGKQIATIDKLLGYTKQTVQDTYLISEIYYKT